MGRGNRDHFRRNDKELARLAKAIGAPAKVAILRTLAERNTCICGEIVQVTPLSQSTVSQHLRELKDLGLIQGRIEGVRSCYCIDREGFERFAELIATFLDDVRQRVSKRPPSCTGE